MNHCILALIHLFSKMALRVVALWVVSLRVIALYSENQGTPITFKRFQRATLHRTTPLQP